MPHLSPIAYSDSCVVLSSISMENSTDHPTADIAPEVAESISTGHDALLDNSDEYVEMTADGLAEFEARLIAEEAEATLGTEQDGPEQPTVASNADIPAPQQPPVAQNAGISAPAPTSDTDLPAGLAACLMRKVTNLATANTQAAGNNPAMPQQSQFQYTRDTALGLASVPSPMNPDLPTLLAWPMLVRVRHMGRSPGLTRSMGSA